MYAALALVFALVIVLCVLRNNRSENAKCIFDDCLDKKPTITKPAKKKAKK